MRTSWLMILFIAVLFFASGNAWSQVANYSFSESVGTYTPITGGTQLVTTTAGVVSHDTTTNGITLPVGSQFTFNGTLITSLTMTADGALILNTTTGASSTTGLSSTATSPGIIAGLNMDLRSTSLAGQVYERRWEDLGSTLVFQWQNAARWASDTAERFSFQIRINETTGAISIVYGDMITIATSTTYVPQVGLRGTTNADYNARRLTTTVPDATPSWVGPNGTTAATSNAHNCRFTSTSPAAFPVSGLTYTYTPPTPCTGTPTAGTVAPLTREVCTAIVPGSFTVSGYSTGVTGITFQWLESSSSSGPFSPAIGGTGASTATYTPPAFSGTTIYYVCRVTCTASSLYADTAPVSVTLPSVPTTQASAATTSNASSFGMSASWTNGNGARRVVYINNSPSFTDPVNGNAAALVANTVYAGSGQQIVLDGTATTVSVTGLSLGTTYYFKVYEYTRCGSGPYDYYYNTTAGTNTASGTTCPAYTIPYSQNFETAVIPAMPACTSVQNAGTGNNWATVNNPGSGFTNKTLKYTYNSTNAANAWFYTSALTLSAGTSYTISYKYGNDSTSWTEKLKVAYGTSPVATAMTNLLADHPTINTAVATNNSVIFTPTTSGAYFFGFNAYSIANQNGLLVDDISITLTPTCYVPTGLTASNLTPATVDVTWTAPTSGTTPLQYEYAVTTSGTPPTSGTVSTSNSVIGVAITPLTNYYLHVRSECVTGSDYSGWATSAPFQFIPGDLCNSAVDLATLTSPYSGTTVGAANNFTSTCNTTGTAPDLYYSIVVPAGYKLTIGQTTNNYDSVHALVYGTCDSQTVVICRDTDIQNEVWTNNTGSSQVAYWIQDGWAAGSGTFTLAWTLTPPPIVVTSFAPAFVCTNELASSVITLTGSNFTGATNVTLNGVSQSFTVINDTTITVALSATSTSGTFVVYNAVTSGTNATALSINVSPTVSPIVGVSEICLSSPITTLTNATGGNVVWSSSNPSIASINAGTGEVTALATGSTLISYSVTSVEGCVTTVTHNIDVREQVVIGTQPAPQVIVTGNNATFSVAAIGTGLTYQWEESTDNGVIFSPLSNTGVYSGVTSATLTLTAVPDTMNAYEYRCVITGTSPCTPETSSSALLTVGNTGISLNPSNVSLCDSGTATFTVSGTGTVSGYQWHEYDGTSDTVLVDDVDHSGSTTATLVVTNANNTRNGYVYYADIIGPANTVTTTSATLNIATGVTVSAPSNQTNCASGSSSVFTVTPSGSFTTVQWQYSSDNVSFNNVVNGTPAGATYTNASTNALTVATTSATPPAGTYYYRALVGANAPCVAVASSSAQLLINNPAIDTAPVATSVFGGDTATLTATSSAPGVTYQWQRSATLAGTYVDVVDGTPATVTYSGVTTGTLSVVTSQTTAPSTTNFYRVVVTSNGCSTASAGVQLTINNYCEIPTATSTLSYFDAFATTGGVTNITNNASGFSTGGYGNFLAQSASQLQGQTVSFTTALTGTSVGVAVWVDWNQNGVFETTERVANTTSYVFTFSGSFVVPVTATPGNTRMRIMMDYSNSNPTNACPATGGRREVEDYTFTVMVPPACEGTPVAGTATSSVANICFSGTANLSATGFPTTVTGISMQWHNSAGPIAGANGATYTTPVLTVPEAYFLRVTCTNSGLSADTNTINIGVNSPSVDTTTNGERCGTGSVNLSAVGSAGTTLSWFAAATGGSPLFTGANFATPSISSTTNYYVSASIVSGSGNAGATGNATSTNGTSVGSHGILFTTTSPNITINSVNIPFTGTGTFTIALRNGVNGTTVSSVTTGTFTGSGLTPVTIPLGINVATPGSYSLIMTAVSGTINSLGYSTATYPSSTLGGAFSVTNGYWFSSGSTNMYFYNLNVSNGCTSARTMVTATVTPPPALSISSASATICSGSSTSTPVTITSTVGDYDSYTWSPSLGVSGNATSGYTFNPSVTTAYTLTATNATGCTNTAAFNVTVNPLPTPIVVTPSTPSICANAVLPILVSASVGGASVSGGCLNGSLYPSATYTPTTCDGLTSNTINNNAWAGEYANVNVSSNTKYTFGSSVATDYLTISDASGTTVLAKGLTPLVWTSGSAEQVRFYIHSNSTCGTQSSSRVRSVICGPSDISFTWSPTTGLYTDAAGSVAYTGDARANVYARPTVTTVYTVNALSAAGCPSSTNVTVVAVTPTTYYADIDGDGYGNEAVVLMSCTPVAGYVTVGGDCNDNVASTHPGAVDVCYDGIDNDCNGIIDNVGLPGGCTSIVSTLSGAQCGSTVSGLSTSMYAVNVVGAQGYRFKITNMTTMSVQIIDRPVNNLQFSSVPGVTLNTQYQVEIGVKYNNVWQPFYGTPCFINTPNPVCTIGSQCGTTLTAMNQWINATYVPNVTAYKFKVINLVTSAEQEFTTGANKFNFTQLANRSYGTTYSVAVSLRNTDGTFLPYNVACNITTPSFPESYVRDSQCDYTALSNTEMIAAVIVPTASVYRFKLYNTALDYEAVIDRSLNTFNLNMFTGLTPGATYSVQVSVKIGTEFGPFGKVCSLTTPGLARSEVTIDKNIVEFKAVAYPNPFAENFKLDVNTSSKEVIKVSVYDMIGKQVESRQLNVSEVESFEVGNNYPSGVYNVIVTQGVQTQTLRVIKR